MSNCTYGENTNRCVVAGSDQKPPFLCFCCARANRALRGVLYLLDNTINFRIKLKRKESISFGPVLKTKEAKFIYDSHSWVNKEACKLPEFSACGWRFKRVTFMGVPRSALGVEAAYNIWNLQ